MDDIAAKLGAQWKTLASHLEMKAADLRVIETDSEDVDMQAKLLLVAWQDREGTQATVESLVTALHAAGFSQIADGLSEAWSRPFVSIKYLPYIVDTSFLIPKNNARLNIFLYVVEVGSPVFSL